MKICFKRRNNFPILKFCLLLCGLYVFSSFGQVKPTELPQKELKQCSIQELDSLFDEVNAVFKEEEIIKYSEEICEKLNGCVLIARNNKIIFQKEIGYLRFYEDPKATPSLSLNEMEKAREKKENQITTSTFFELASLTKQFTAAAILKLAEEEKLKLNSEVQTFFSNFPYKGISIHQLLTHTSGIPEYLDFPIRYFKDTSLLTTNDEILSILMTKKPALEFAPGHRFLYTNTNYVILAKIIEKVINLSFENYIRQSFLVPAGIEKAFFITEIDAQDSLAIACGHLLSKSEVPFDYLDGTVGDKGMYCTINDLYRWEQQLFSGNILSETSLNKATAVQNILKNKKTPNEQYGYGFRIEMNKNKKNNDDKLVFHGGLWHGFQNLFIYRPKDQVFIIFLSNFRNKAHFRKSDKYFQILDGA